MLVSANIFQPLINVFAAVIKFFHQSVGLPWGWSIILLTACVRLVLVPLAIRQFQSMRRLQAHQPELKAIQAKYKDDKQRQQQEMMKFYKENNVNPFASCLPMILQLPVFISLFYMLRKNLRTDICGTIQTAYQHAYAVANKISFKAAEGQTTYCTNPHYAHGSVPGASFLFIHDITNNATGVTLVALLVLYIGTQLVSTLIMAGPTMDKSQRRMMMIIPFVFVPVAIGFPAGLLVYWITTNAWTMVQQFTLKQILGAPVVAPASMIMDETGATEHNVAARLKGLLGGRQDEAGGALDATSNGRTRPAGGPPPRPPRKKKKRSGRRR